MKQVEILDKALEDLAKGEDFYERQQPGLGAYFSNSILSDAASLSTRHGFHAKRYGFHWLLASKFPFGIYYRESDLAIVVYAVLDQRSRPASIRRLLNKRK